MAQLKYIKINADILEPAILWKQNDRITTANKKINAVSHKICSILFKLIRKYWNVYFYVFVKLFDFLHCRYLWSHHFESFMLATMTWLTIMEYLCNKWPRICSTCSKHFSVLIHDITGFVTRLTRQVALVDKELLTLPEVTPGF